MNRRWLDGARRAAALLLFLSASAQAATFVVTSTADAGAGSLRQAVTDANGAPGADTITFALAGCPCTITLASNLIISDEVTITGPGMDVLAVSGGNAIQPFLTAGVPVTLSDFTVRNGLTTFGGGALRSYGPLTLLRMKFLANHAPNVGGAVMYGGALTVLDSVFEQNEAVFGGALYTEGAPLEAWRSTFRANAATGQGGAIYSPGDLAIADSLLEFNTSVNAGALSTWGSAATVTGTTFHQNTASNNGGAVSGQNVLLQECTFTNNTAASGGGAVEANDGVSVVNSTFTANTAQSSGGAIHSWGTSTVADSTFTGNSTPYAGGAITVYSQMTITGSRFTGNTAGQAFIGGGAINFDYYATALTVSNSVFEGNSAPAGGAILGFSQNGTLTIVGSDFRGNVSTQAGGAIATTYGGVIIDRSRFFANSSVDGGALAVGQGLPAQVKNSLFAGNTTTSARGRSIFLGGAGAVSLLHVTIANAGTRLTGSAILGSSTPSPVIANSIIADHEVALRLTGGSAAPDRVLVWNTGFPPPVFQVQGGATIDTSLVTPGDPVFLDPGGEDYRLGVGSAAVDLSPTFRLAADYEGDARPQGAAYDAGFDERVAGAQAITFAALADRLIGQSPFTVSATASSGLAVSFSSLTTPVCTVSGTTVTLVAMGTCTIAANQAGDLYWAAAPQVARSFAVTLPRHTLTVSKSGTGSGTVSSTPPGIACGATCTASFDAGASVTLQATASAGSFFNGWGGACTGAGACSVTMDAAKALSAEFKPNTAIPRLANISTRMQVLTGNDVLIGGFIIGGTQAKTVVVRARGPSLAAAGVPGVLANPVLQLFAGATQIAANDNWQEAANQAALSASGFAPPDPFESAILTTLTPGAYTAIVTGAGLTTGVGIIEVFEVDLPEVPLVNIATRGAVLTGADVMIGGFIIQGDSPQTVIVRARGPSLTAAGVPNVLSNPMLQLFSGATQIAVNDNWGDGPDAAAIQAAGFAPAHVLESAIRVTLNPGAYTAIVTGAGGATGVAIVEVFAQ